MSDIRFSNPSTYFTSTGTTLTEFHAGGPTPSNGDSQKGAILGYHEGFGTPANPAWYFARDGGLYSGAYFCFRIAGSGTGNSRKYYWPLQYGDTIGHPNGGGGQTPIMAFMGGVCSDVNGPSLVLTNSSALSRAHFLLCADDGVSPYRSKFAVGIAGQLYWGHVDMSTVSLDGGTGSSPTATALGTAFDTNLYRSAANVLKTDDQFAATDGITTLYATTATISDANFAVAPPNGTIAIIRTAGTNYIGVKGGGVWTTVATS